MQGLKNLIKQRQIMKTIDLKDYEAIIFDLDGTILNSSKDVMLCLEEAFKLENLTIDKSRLTSNIIGPPLNVMVKTILPEIQEEKIQNVVDNYNKIYNSEKYDFSTLYEGIYDLLKALKKAGKKIFLATNKPNISMPRLIKKYNLNMFKEICSFDQNVNELNGKILSKSEMIQSILEKNNLNKDKTVMIGDALGDIKAAKDNGIVSVGALWGYGDDKQPLLENADFIAENVQELSINFLEEVT